MRPFLFQQIIFLLVFSSCNNAQVLIKHVLTETDSVRLEKRIQVNRYDNFILYNYNQADSSRVKLVVKLYSDSFSKKFDNYVISFYRNSKFADTNYIKQFDQKYAYKALIDEQPFFEFRWWSGHLLLKPETFKHW